MSKKANPKLIGSFVVGGLVLALTAIFLLSAGFFREKVKCVAFFDGSVKGLNVGAPVTFRGVKVGTVTDIQLRIGTDHIDHLIPVFFEIEAARLTVVREDGRPNGLDVKHLIERGLRAQLTVQSFVTGLLMIELDFKPETRERLVGSIREYPEIPTIPSDLEDFLRRFEEAPIEELLEQVTEILKTVREFLDSPETLAIIRGFHEALEGLNALVMKIDVHADPLLTEGTLAMREMSQTFGELNRRLSSILDRADGTMDAMHNVAGEVDRRLPDLMEKLESTVKSTQEAMEGMAAVAQEDSPLMHNLQQLSVELTSAARSIRVLADYLQQHPESLLRGRRP